MRESTPADVDDRSRARPADPRAWASRGSTARSSANGLPRAPRVRHLVGSSIGAWRFAAACLHGSGRHARASSRAPIPSSATRRGRARALRLAVRARRCWRASSRGARTRSCPTRTIACTSSRCAAAGRSRAIRGCDDAARVRHGGARQRGRAAATSRASSIARCSTTRATALLAVARSRGRGSRSASTRSTPTRCRSTRANLGEALLASASIPLVLEGVADIPRAPARHLLGRRHHRLSPAPALSSRAGPRALSAFHRPHRAGLARQGHAVAQGARRVARQRGARRRPRASTSRRCRTGKLPDRSDFTRFAGDDAGTA